ncbi:hypothetical protein NEUTE1DRAFT_115699 [Neurospora tetrasperma FGSC 2508]|uniref:Uncharacterized protein n=1 Tax=Neurospora tetrasperma (strain FGSC 2508 / ATCC MYA-4615 / P0657) TaxID=510951 RepID=F8MBU8_NEUT8|nr:uncharacterized protein NEUTE1DRAFT_115699 [Neurospora tetrasperma FGSC 2508]EGO60356.1 hypothetical protein NEUTE1DRAFT_115699 [Neurospora tetrasperma FGSC 2508]EGZ75669.1 hypothetical protein NEUTE2DRAFT_143781 [Neurospora tetrasperma FGSC 2509]
MQVQVYKSITRLLYPTAPVVAHLGQALRARTGLILSNREALYLQFCCMVEPREH